MKKSLYRQVMFVISSICLILLMSNDEETNNLIVFCKTPRTRKEICDYLGLNSVTYAIQTYVNPLVEAGVIKLSIPDKPKSPKQLYYSGEREK